MTKDIKAAKKVYKHLKPYLTSRDKRGLLVGLTGSGALIASSLLLAWKKSQDHRAD